MMRLDAQRWRRRRGMARMLDALGASDGLTRYVGGSIRDHLLGIPVNDIDLATRIEPEEVIRRLEQARIKAVPTGLAHGTITAVSGGHPYEVTTLRRDVSTDGRRATVAFTSDWKDDAARRDFTINALSADPVSGELFDYFGGLEDLEGRRVRFIGDPLERIAEDHLRILRFFRFHARFGAGEPDRDAVRACAVRANDLMALSRERIADELLKLLGVTDPGPTVAIMLANAILKPVLPEILPDAAKRLADLVDAEREARADHDPIRRLAAILPPDRALANEIAARLRLSNKAKKRLVLAAERTLDTRPRQLAYRIGKESTLDRLLLDGRIADARALLRWTVPTLAIGGGDLIELGVPRGPAVAQALKRIDQRWADAGFPAGAAFDAIVSEEVGRSSLRS